jgi:MYXO-CTERM domain-containing protein
MKCSRLVAVPAVLVSLLLGVSSSAHACTINTTEVGKRIRWSTETIGLQMDSEFENYLGPGEAYAALAMGFEAWRGLPRVPDMMIMPGTPATLGHHDGHPTNGIYLLRDWPYDAAKLAVTVVTYEMDTGRLLDADIVVNGKANFALLPEPTPAGDSSYDLAAVLTHEAGHVLGLGESSAGVDATMWPYAKPDDTDKRTLAEDDEDGAIESYMSAPPPAASSCGANTVGGRASSRSGIAFGLFMLAMLPALRITRRRKLQTAALAGLLVCALSVGFDFQSARSVTAEERAAQLDDLLQHGTRDDRARVEAIATNSEGELARRAQLALRQLLSRPGHARIAANSVEGRARIAQLMGRGTRIMVGRTTHATTVQQGGLFFTEYQVRTQGGDTTTLRVAGGAQKGIGQRVIDAEPPPVDESEVAVVQQPDGSQHWAYHQSGTLFGGHLGDAAAIDGAL